MPVIDKVIRVQFPTVYKKYEYDTNSFIFGIAFVNYRIKKDKIGDKPVMIQDNLYDTNYANFGWFSTFEFFRDKMFITEK